MKVMDESFDDELSKRLKEFSAVPRESLWDSISARIETEDREVRLQKKMRIGWIFIFSSILIGGFYYLVSLDAERDSSIVTTGKKKELTNGNPDDVASKHAEVRPQRPLQKKSDVQKIEGQYPKQYTSNFESNTPANFEIVESTTSTERESDPAGIPANHLEIVPANRALTNEVPLDSNNNLTAVKTKAAMKIEHQADDSDLEKKRNRPNIYFTIMPTLGYQRIEPNSQDNLIVESIDRISAFSTDRLGVRAELGVEYPVENRFNIFGGFVYFQRHQTIGYMEKTVGNTEILQGPNGEIILQPEFHYEHKSFEYEVRNLGLQIGLSYQLSKKKFLQTLGTGIEFHLALNKLQESSEFTNNPSAYVFYNFYYRIQYPADTKLRAVLQPTLNYSFYINQNENSPFYVKPYGLGLNIGFTYNLN
jgi:hypothetical protein